MADLVATIAELQSRLDRERSAGRTVALVPTMGALHAGHVALVERARELADVVVVSIFVNPLQFGPTEDLDQYPRALDEDVAQLQGNDLVFAPAAGEMYPDGQSQSGPEAQTRISAGSVASLFEGATRPGHFDGMLTVVAKLFGIVQPDFAVFGQKDAQQVYLVRRMIADLNLPVQLEVVPTVREQSGLALSSRNRYLSAEQKLSALVLSASLEAAAASAGRGVDAARAAAHTLLEAESAAEVDYVELVDAETFLPVASGFRGAAIAIIAAHVGTTRLIDNRLIDIS